MCRIDVAYQDFMVDNERKNLSSETCRYYRENLNRFISWLAAKGIVKANRISEEYVDDYFLFLLRTVPNRTSVNTYMRAVRRFVNYLSEQKIIKPFTVSLLKDMYKIKPTFDRVEIDRILSSVNPANAVSVIMLLLLSTGMRSRSLCELHVRDINFADGYLDLHITKNGSPLCPPISRAVANCLKAYIEIMQLNDGDYLFSNRSGKKLNKNSLDERINRGLSSLGIKKTGVHIFRHTFGKIMSMNGCPTVILQKWLGHSDIKMTQRYTDLYSDDLRKTFNLVPTSGFKYANN